MLCGRPKQYLEILIYPRDVANQDAIASILLIKLQDVLGYQNTIPGIT